MQECRKGCGACCIAPSISSPIKGMPDGKPAGVKCIHLTEKNLCALFGSNERPDVCIEFTPTKELCGTCREEALENLTKLEEMTKIT